MKIEEKSNDIPNNKQREKIIRHAREIKLSQENVGKKLGITRQRVQQIERKIGLGPRRPPGVKIRHQIICEECLKSFETVNKYRTFCSRDCFYKSRKENLPPELKKINDEVKKAQNQKRATKYYHEVFKQRPDWRQIVKDRNARKLEKKQNVIQPTKRQETKEDKTK